MRIQSSLLPNRFMSPWVIGLSLYLILGWTQPEDQRQDAAPVHGWGHSAPWHAERVELKELSTGISVKFSLCSSRTHLIRVWREQAGCLRAQHCSATVCTNPNEELQCHHESVTRLPCKHLHVIRTPLSPFPVLLSVLSPIRHSL